MMMARRRRDAMVVIGRVIGFSRIDRLRRPLYEKYVAFLIT